MEAKEASAPLRGSSLSLLPICQDVFAVPQIAVGEYDRALLPNQIAAAIEKILESSYSARNKF